MSEENVYKEMNEKLDFLLKDHGVEFDHSKEDIESLATLHKKADALIVAHNLVIPEEGNSVAALQPKLNQLIQGHGQTFDDSDLDPDSFDTVLQKLDVLVNAHKG